MHTWSPRVGLTQDIRSLRQTTGQARFCLRHPLLVKAVQSFGEGWLTAVVKNTADAQSRPSFALSPVWYSYSSAGSRRELDRGSQCIHRSVRGRVQTYSTKPKLNKHPARNRNPKSLNPSLKPKPKSLHPEPETLNLNPKP